MRIRKTIIKPNLDHNLSLIEKIANGKKIIWFLKANSYGHGTDEICQELLNRNQRLLGVYELSEAVYLDQQYEDITIFILDGLTESEWNTLHQIPDLKNKLIICLNKIEDLGHAKMLSQNKNISFHMFTETGFNWYGIQNVEEFCHQAKKNNIEITGICSHFALSNAIQDDQATRQLAFFDQHYATAQKYFPEIERHITNSWSLWNLPNSQDDYYRIGRLMYGIMPEHPEFKQIIKIETEILQVKTVRVGEKIGYGGTFTADKDMRIAILAIGYKDGLDRRASNNGFFQAHGQLCPILGRIAMNITIIDVTNIPVKAGEYAIFTDDIDQIRISDIAERIGCLDYELLTQFRTS